MNISFNPILWNPRTPQEWVMSLMMWLAILAVLCGLVAAGEWLLKSSEKRDRGEWSKLGSVCVIYTGSFVVAIMVYLLALSLIPPFASAVNHFFASGIRPF